MADMLAHARSRSAVLALAALLASALVLVAPARVGAAPGNGIVNGSIGFPQKDHPKIEVRWFDANWNYLGRKGANSNFYSLTLPAGTYHLQFVDQRPSYVIAKYAPTDITVRVRSNALSKGDVRMQRGGYVTGTVRTGQRKPAGGARVVAANRAENSFETTANKKGQFAIGGLPSGKYSIFTWDKKKRWVSKSTWAGGVKPGKGKDISVRMNKRAGVMTAYLFTPNGLLPGTTSVTVTSKATGQWWTARSKRGTADFRGLYPGRYKLKFDGLGVWLPATLTVKKANVRANKPTFGSVRLTKRGGWLEGHAVDGGNPAYGIAGAQVQLFNAYGTKLDETTSADDGYFKLDGQLRTQAGMAVVINPPGDGWTTGAAWCHFLPTRTSDLSVVQGKKTWLGNIGVTRDPQPLNPACA